jgi:GAF domain-containing protein
VLNVNTVAETKSDAEGATDTSLARVPVEVEALLRSSGIHAALAYLNHRTRYRFSGVYRVDPPMLRNVHLYDRENPTLNVSGDINTLRDTYCSIVGVTGSCFETEDASRDPRLSDHYWRETILSYIGVPIRLPSGNVCGTLCHFDVRPRLPPRGERAVLEQIAPLIGDWLLQGRVLA